MHNSRTVNLKRKLRTQGELDNVTKYVIGRQDIEITESFINK